ncbi:MAG: DNA mismatch repair protein [Acidobacteria bacterium]|nr:MAG: DNA mismatch repair protein [Acidobacteriota bacterium]REK05882.1 MAG: DNA mismatch repair protein [Acidobacteriota bacterium]
MPDPPPSARRPDGLVLPDLLQPEPFLGVDYHALAEVLGMAFLGRELGTQIHDHLARARVPPAGPGQGAFRPEFFAHDLFVRELLQECFGLTIDGRTYPVNVDFLFHVLTHCPTDPETVRFRQEIVQELEDDSGLRRATYRLYRDLFDFLSLLKTPGYQSSLDTTGYHLDILKQARLVIDSMESEFATARSGLRRLHEAATATQSEAPYRGLAQLLDYERGMARMTLDVVVGGDGRIRHFAVRDLEEARANRNWVSPLRRFVQRLSLAYRGYPLSNRELMNKLVHEVFRQISPSLIPLVQLLGHLEFYLCARTFRDRARAAGLEVCLPRFVDADESMRLDGLFNPLLLAEPLPPVATELAPSGPRPVTLITGPNSGGKTRLLQAIGLAQVLGQSGLYAPAREARLRIQDGLFVSLIEEEGAHQTEGRLGRELVRIRSLFEELATRSMVILDELCSGTNPSEGVEVFSMVLRLLRQVEPTAYVTTHFLDYARSLQRSPVVDDLEFLQVEVTEDLRSTYQFVPGVAETSLAAVTAERLGVTFESLAESIQRRR